MRPSRWRPDALFQCRCSAIGTMYRCGTGLDTGRAQTPKMFELMSLQTTGLLNSKCLHRASVIGETGSCCFFTNAIYYAGFRISMGGFCFYNWSVVSAPGEPESVIGGIWCNPACDWRMNWCWPCPWPSDHFNDSAAARFAMPSK